MTVGLCVRVRYPCDEADCSDGVVVHEDGTRRPCLQCEGTRWVERWMAVGALRRELVERGQAARSGQ